MVRKRATPWFACVLAAWALCAPSRTLQAASGELAHYQATFDPATRSMRVALCLNAAHGEVFFAADSAWAMQFVHEVARTSAGALRQQDSGWRAQRWQPGECLTWRADLAAIAAQHRPDVGWSDGDDLVAAPQLWLLRADAQVGDAHIRVDLPANWSISAPWPPATSAPANASAEQAQAREFAIPATPSDWSAATAVGRFSEQRIELPGGVLRVSMVGAVDASQRDTVRHWFDRVAHAVLTAYGQLPLPDVQVLMISVHGRGEAVEFGQSVRGQGNALQLLIDPQRPASEFDDDWMAVHELSHLMHPYLGDRGAWLAEGLATYYQNVLRARGGLLTAAQAWDRLREGFGRGARQTSAVTLEQAATDMHQTHAFQRVYWAGAVFWLAVDLDLRRASSGQIGLDTVLGRFRACCLPAYREWRPEEFVAQLDSLAGTQLISARYRDFAAMRTFPDWSSLYDDLGIAAVPDGLRFDNAARDASLREAIMRPR